MAGEASGNQEAKAAEQTQGVATSLAGHTPGPWTAHVHFAKTYGGRVHAMITAADRLVPIGAVVLGVEGCSQNEGRANANMFTAAPAMFEALEAAAARLELMPQGPLVKQTLDYVRAGITLASGGKE